MQTVVVSRAAHQPIDVLELWQAQRIETAEAENVLATAVARARWTQDFTAAAAYIGTGRVIYGGRYTHLTHGLAYGHRIDASTVRKTTRFFLDHCEKPVVRLASLWPETIAEFERAGYQSISQSLVVARELTTDLAVSDQGSTVCVSPGSTEPDLSWIRASTQGFCDRDDVNECEMQIGAALALSPEAMLFSTSSAAGEICATASLTVQNSVAMFFGDSTRTAFRGLGLQRALIAARLQHSIALGCDLAVAEVEERTGSARNYEKAGFQPLYRRITFALDR